MIRNSKGSAQFQLFGWMAVVLGAGDSFHLVPRALALCTTGLDSYAFQLGLGKWITSVTMTVFYVLLYYVWRQRYHIQGQKAVTWAVYALSAARVILCMMPQNQWLTNHRSRPNRRRRNFGGLHKLFCKISTFERKTLLTFGRVFAILMKRLCGNRCILR